MLAYREEDNLIHKLHPLTTVVFVAVVFVLALVFSHPVYLLGLLLVIGTVIVGAGHYREWKSYLKFSLVMIAIIIIVNGLFVHVGQTIIFTSPDLLGRGRINVSLEALAFGAGMGIRLLVIISAFCLYTCAVHPDKVMKLFGRGSKSVLIMTLSTRLFPLMVKDYYRIIEVQRCRGVKFDQGRWWQRARNLLPIVSILLVSSLERALQLAESMHARGYGSGPRTSYSRELWRPRDYLILTTVGVGLVLGIWAALQGWSSYSYYPRLPAIQSADVEMTGLIVLMLMVPAVLNWGWGKWPLLKSKI
ncbi:MAG: energy-coupling factor transporter transmembrane protein EcfT [Syntrophomonadaceae bacterium]|nr:energy-coupling factor transporter transmembrane protein EcfT [Syntrophomonadaceae bacterium]